MIIRSMNNAKEFPEGKTVQECLKALDAFPRGTLAAQSGGVVRELNDPLMQDCTLVPLTLENEEGRRVYERSLRFVMLLALRHLFPMKRVRIEYSVGYGVFVRLPDVELHRQDIVRIENEMRRLTELDLEFEKRRWTKEDAIQYFKDEGQEDKVELLSRRPVPYFNMYSIDGMWEYFYGAMTVSTGYVRVFTMFELRGGFVLQLPAGADFDHAAPYVYRPKYLEVFSQSAEWCKILGVTNVSDLSRMIEEKNLRHFIRVNEALHESALNDIAKKIHEQNKHIVLVAGPSSSGKTTFAGRLGIHLQMYGHLCRRISMDDFFINRDDIPLQIDGTRDFDSIDALDVKLLADTLTGLLNGEEVFMPNFDFTSGTKDYLTPPTTLKPGEIIILEGIHGLTWSFFAPGGFKDIEFGFMKQYLTPYCTCGTPLGKGPYIAGALMPLAVLGIVPWIVSLLCGSTLLLYLSLVMILAAGGDMLIVAELLRHRSDAEEQLVCDHPTQAGCVLFER